VPDRKPKKGYLKSGLHIIKCSSCGKEILLIPDVQMMGKAIEAHVEMHTRKIADAMQAEAEAERIRDELTAQVLQKASQTEE
jgi:hypothetical protein